MRWVQAAVAILAVMATTGCPSEFGKDGRVAKAVHHDAVDMAIQQCSDSRRDEVCGNGGETSLECRKCGGKR